MDAGAEADILLNSLKMAQNENKNSRKSLNESKSRTSIIENNLLELQAENSRMEGELQRLRQQANPGTQTNYEQEEHMTFGGGEDNSDPGSEYVSKNREQEAELEYLRKLVLESSSGDQATIAIETLFQIKKENTMLQEKLRKTNLTHSNNSLH